MAQVLGSLTEAQLFDVPAGFTNNIAWNFGHVLVTQQLLCYQLSNLPMAFDEAFVNDFKKGSSPAQWQSRPDIEFIRTRLVECADSFRDDYSAGKFETFESYTTSAGVVLGSIDDALNFNNVHEGIHLGYIMALVRAQRQGPVHA